MKIWKLVDEKYEFDGDNDRGVIFMKSCGIIETRFLLVKYVISACSSNFQIDDIVLVDTHHCVGVQKILQSKSDRPFIRWL